MINKIGIKVSSNITKNAKLKLELKKPTIPSCKRNSNKTNNQSILTALTLKFKYTKTVKMKVNPVIRKLKSSITQPKINLESVKINTAKRRTKKHNIIVQEGDNKKNKYSNKLNKAHHQIRSIKPNQMDNQNKTNNSY